MITPHNGYDPTESVTDFCKLDNHVACGSVCGCLCHKLSSLRKMVSDHLFDNHGIMLTRTEFRRMTLDELQALDTCS